MPFWDRPQPDCCLLENLNGFSSPLPNKALLSSHNAAALLALYELVCPALLLPVLSDCSLLHGRTAWPHRKPPFSLSCLLLPEIILFPYHPGPQLSSTVKKKNYHSQFLWVIYVVLNIYTLYHISTSVCFSISQAKEWMAFLDENVRIKLKNNERNWSNLNKAEKAEVHSDSPYLNLNKTCVFS